MGLFGFLGSKSKSMTARLTQAAVEGVTYPFGPTGVVLSHATTSGSAYASPIPWTNTSLSTVLPR